MIWVACDHLLCRDLILSAKEWQKCQIYQMNFGNIHRFFFAFYWLRSVVNELLHMFANSEIRIDQFIAIGVYSKVRYERWIQEILHYTDYWSNNLTILFGNFELNYTSGVSTKWIFINTRNVFVLKVNIQFKFHVRKQKEAFEITLQLYQLIYLILFYKCAYEKTGFSRYGR